MDSFHTSDKDCTSEIRVGVLVEALIHRSGDALEMHHGQVLAVFGPRLLDARDEDAHEDEARGLADVDGRARDVGGGCASAPKLYAKKSV